MLKRTVISRYRPQELDAAIAEKLAEGWELVGEREYRQGSWRQVIVLVNKQGVA